MYKAYKFRFYPNNKQLELINKTFGSSRYVYNYYLDKMKNNGYVPADIADISTKIGTKDDAKTEETLFGKTALLLEKVQNVGNMVYKVYTGTVSANDKLDEVLVNTNINALDDTATAYITSKFNEYRNAPSGDKSYIIEELVTWLRDNGYAK